MKSKPVTVRLEKEVFERAEELAKVREITLAELMREAVNQILDRAIIRGELEASD